MPAIFKVASCKEVNREVIIVVRETRTLAWSKKLTITNPSGWGSGYTIKGEGEQVRMAQLI
ncbi:MAG: hypothetical protein KGM16_16475 [Bacteroidota bacterium]|nr:hypothetical protein [Bacteroidota bacterium]